ncbi:right-handed parallel beta-helix repeat-containing protein [Streptomyces sp. NPDC051567]|uniref:right-handed parallel beta-helix repeat-containing protein n=1 Tax=Streptomyces sp. NPDC051567 TaxID=3365660 RepID=UPI00379450FD
MVRKYVVSPYGGRRAHPGIASALAAAAQRGGAARIEIAPGRYEETLTVRGEVELVAAGDPGSVVVGPLSGAVLDALGAVRVHGLVFTGRDADVVSCRAGALTLERCEIQAHNGVSVHAGPNTSVTLLDSTVLHGRTLFRGSHGLVERCRFTDATDNAIAAIEGARISVRDSRIDGSMIHGIRVSGARAQVTGCELTRTGQAAIVADTQAELTVTGCVISAVHEDAIMFSEQSRGSVDSTHVVDAQHGIVVVSGADPVVRGCVLTRCRDTGINVHSAGRGRFEECEVVDAGNVAVFSTRGGAPEVHGCRISRGKVGIAVTEAARGRFTRIEVRDLVGTALRVLDGSRAEFENVLVERCPSGLEAQGGAGTTVEVTGARFSGFDMAAATASGQAWMKLTRVAAEHGAVAFCAAEEAQLLVHDCDAKAVSTGGAVAVGRARLVARNLTVTGSEGLGLCGAGSAYLDVTDATFTDCASAGAALADECTGRLVNCSVEGTRGVAVVHNDRFDLTRLRTELRIVRKVTEPAGTAPTTVNHYHGPVFNAVSHGVQLAWNNSRSIQQQTNKEGPPP